MLLIQEMFYIYVVINKTDLNLLSLRYKTQKNTIWYYKENAFLNLASNANIVSTISFWTIFCTVLT